MLYEKSHSKTHTTIIPFSILLQILASTAKKKGKIGTGHPALQSEGNSKLQPLKLPCFPFSLYHHYFYTDSSVLQESIVHGFFKANDQV